MSLRLYCLFFLFATRSLFAAPTDGFPSSGPANVSVDVAKLQMNNWYRHLNPAPSVAALTELKDWLKTHPDDHETEFYLFEAVHRRRMASSETGFSEMDLLARAARGGYAPAEATFGYCQLVGDGVPVNLDGGKKLLQASLDKNEPAAQYYTGALFFSGKGGFVKDLNQAKTFLESAAKDDFNFAWAILGLLEAERKEYDAAVKDMNRGIEAGDPQASAVLARWLSSGTVTRKNLPEAIRYMRQAIANSPDNPDYDFALGEWLILVETTSENEQEAVQWYAKAAALGHAEAKFHLSLCHIFGIGIPANIESGIKELQEVAAGNLSEAQNTLAKLYLEGVIVDRNPVEARRLFEAAAKSGDRNSIQYLKLMDMEKR